MRVYAGLSALVGWFALILQLVLIVTVDSDISVGGRIVNFFSYFTILSNILVSITFTVAALGVNGAFGRFFSRPSVQSGIALYISVTGLVYFFVLRTIWAPEGWAFVADALLHYATPLLYVGFWLVFVRKGTLRLSTIPWMLAFPVVYAVYSLTRGPIVDWYPYPFLNVAELGGGQVAVNVVAMLVGFIVLAAIYVGLDRLLGGRMRPAAT